MRHRYLRVQLGSMVARARMLMGEKLSFDQEAEALYDAKPPRYSDAHFDSLLARLDTLLPGQGPVAERYQRFRDRLNIPAAKVDTVFKTAIAACRARTLAHIQPVAACPPKSPQSSHSIGPKSVSAAWCCARPGISPGTERAGACAQTGGAVVRDLAGV